MEASASGIHTWMPVIGHLTDPKFSKIQNLTKGGYSQSTNKENK
jgi:hypothetical protein